jgi:hypothetical protein
MVLLCIIGAGWLVIIAHGLGWLADRFLGWLLEEEG